MKNINFAEETCQKNKRNFQNGKIYIIRNTQNELTYIGSTCQSLSNRMAQHRKSFNSPKTNNTKLFKEMKSLGYENFYIELLEHCPCSSLDELRKREGELMREMKSELNTKIECRTPKEYYQDNTQRVCERIKNYKRNNKEQIKITSQKYYQDNKEDILQKTRQYKEENKEKIGVRLRRYYEQVRKGKKFECQICKCIISIDSKARHERSNNHQQNLAKSQEQPEQEPEAKQNT